MTCYVLAPIPHAVVMSMAYGAQSRLIHTNCWLCSRAGVGSGRRYLRAAAAGERMALQFDAKQRAANQKSEVDKRIARRKAYLSEVEQVWSM
jgi:hypothetical protein